MFYPDEWKDGDVTLLPFDLQGIFINVCCYYWKRNCNIDITKLKQRYNTVITEQWESLISSDILKVGVDGKIIIQFLDEQWDKRQSEYKQKSDAGKKGMESRWGVNNTPITDHNNIEEDKDKNKIKKKIFKPPTIIEVREYCKERKNTVNVNKWMSHYEANGWMVGKNKMKDWMAAVRTWENSDFGTDVKHPVVHDRTKTEGAPVGFGIPNPKAIPIPQTLKDKFNIK